MKELSNNFDSCHMLRAQAGVLPVCSNIGDFNWLASYCRKRNCSTHYLSAALTLGSVYFD
jgi:hypothetical protein